ncbi:uncharacterized protein [Cicer arietinum]|uniref:Uncharacterized protein LOC101512139 n=1 Tax=Cicer arietinum TaxID=3827 RepID=A0A1S2YWB5_CICAR|nr:uncharacterized protein LOC101512139 [Cicer arietinum]
MFNYIVCAIEEFKDISTLSLEELQGTLEARELRMEEKNIMKSGDQALTAQVYKKRDKKNKWKKNKFKISEDKYESSSKGGSANGKPKGKSKNFDKKKVQYYNCDKFRHFVDEYWCGKGKKKKKDEDEACAAQEDDSDSNTVLLMATTNEERFSLDSGTVLLMASTNEEHFSSQLWFLDAGCSNHMTSHKEPLMDIDTSRRSKIRFADDRTLEVEGAGNMVIRRRNGKTMVIENVLYVPRMKSNLLSIGQLIQKGYQVIMKDDTLKMYDGEKNMILKAHLSKNITFVINIQATDIQCLKAVSLGDED